MARRLAAVLAADVAGYSRLMGADEEGTLTRLKSVRRNLVDPIIASHRGRIVKTTGDGMLVEFASVVDAMRCAIEVQEGMAGQDAAGLSHTRIEFRIGIHVGDIIIDDNDIFGDGVNIAARLEGIAEPGGVCISDDAYRQVRDRIKNVFDDKGEIALKNIARPVRVFELAGVKQPGLKIVEPTNKLALPDKPSIAVLPFQNMSGDPEQEYFADGMVEDIITALSRFKSLFVIARNSSFVYKGKLIDIEQVGRELGVRYVLEGSVRKSANRVRITGQLIDTGTGAHHWADRFEGDLADIFDLQDRMTENVVGAIVPAMERAEIERATRKPTDNLDAYTLFWRGQAKLYQQLADREANREALRLFKRAIELDPDYASAFARAASCYAFAKTNGWLAETEDEISDASRLVHRAVELGKHDANVLAECGWTLSLVVRDLDGGSALIDRSLALNPNVIEALNWGGWTKLWLGEPEEAVQRFTRALRLSPLDPWAVRMRIGIAHAYFFLERYEQAASLAVGALRETPDYQAGLRIAAASNAMAGNGEQARKLVIRLQDLNPVLRLSKLKSVLGPYRHVEHVHRYEEALRAAGLAE